MQFKHPEILWALLLLVIPIFIHLFQLRRFKKVPFTNVAMLQKVISKSRKSSMLKKWLLLVMRLGLIAALVIAFAQPFAASEKALKPSETVIYLDNSFSMQAKSGGVPLLKKAVQELIQSIGQESVFSLFTNNLVFRDVTIAAIQNQLLTLDYTQNQFNIGDVQLKAATLFSQNNNIKRLLLLSDFQGSEQDSLSNTTIETHYVQLKPDSEENVAIDSVFLDGGLANQNNLSVLLSGGYDQNIPVSLYNDDELIAKSSASFNSQGTAKIVFSLPEKTQIDGRLEINDLGLGYDNTFFFSINKTKIIKVLAITEADSQYLEKLFSGDEFEFNTVRPSQLNYSLIDSQNMVILDNVSTIPESLRRSLKNFYDNGGSLVIIPGKQIDLQAYNTMLGSFGSYALNELVPLEQRVTDIAFEHPLYQNVFEKSVSNFQYPRVSSYFTTKSKTANILSFASGDSFLVGGNRFYLFTSPLTAENSNFKSSPLIVPSFYNMALFSLKSPDLYFLLGQEAQTDIATTLGKDGVLHLSKNEMEIIPRQQSFNNKVSLFFGENPQDDGIFSVQNKDSVLEKIGFNYSRAESKLQYADMKGAEQLNGQDSIASLFDFIESENEQTAYWKWFVILALVFALAEALIQKLIA